MNELDTLENLKAIMAATDIRYFDVAMLARCGVATVQRTLRKNALPIRRDSREKLARFVVANRNAQRRSDLRFIDF